MDELRHGTDLRTRVTPRGFQVAQVPGAGAYLIEVQQSSSIADDDSLDRPGSSRLWFSTERADGVLSSVGHSAQLARAEVRALRDMLSLWLEEGVLWRREEESDG